jgi:hypothetical protein
MFVLVVVTNAQLSSESESPCRPWKVNGVSVNGVGVILQRCSSSPDLSSTGPPIVSDDTFAALFHIGEGLLARVGKLDERNGRACPVTSTDGVPLAAHAWSLS